VYDFIDYKIEEDTVLERDGLIVCGKIDKKFLDFAPPLVLEVLTPSTALKDRNTKFTLYQQQGVKYYLIADVEKDVLEIYALENAVYVLQNFSNNDFVPFNFDNDCAIQVNLSHVFD
jgi:Uma2 family endonuclease